MFCEVLLTCCCLVFNSYIQAAPVDTDSCEDDQLYVTGAYACIALTDPNFPSQDSLGFYENAVPLCEQKVNFDQCCATCTIVLEKANKTSTTPTLPTTKQTTEQTTEQKTEQESAKGNEDIEIKYKTYNEEDTSNKKQEPESVEEVDVKITIVEKDTKRNIDLIFPKGRSGESGQPFRIDFH